MNEVLVELKQISRQLISILAWQVDGLCGALEKILATHAQVGPSTLALVKRLESALLSTSSGPGVEVFAKLDDSMSTGDILVRAEVLRATILTFLSPEQLVEQRKQFGFSHRPST